MKPYLAIFSSHFRSLLQYRAAALAGVGTQLFFGLVRLMIFDAFYRSSTIVQPMTLDEALLVIDDDYLVYLDVASNRPAVLLRRADGNFDLVEC